jgi:hypothetical protein
MIREFSILFLLIAAPMFAGISAAPAGERKDPSPEKPPTAEPIARIPFRNVGGHVVLPVRVNGSRSLNMALDTGMSAPIVMLMHRELQAEAGIQGGDPVLIAGAGGGEPRQGRVFPGDRPACQLISGTFQPSSTRPL